MLKIIFGIGIYSYIILLIGLLHLLYFYPVLIVTMLFIVTEVILCKKDLQNLVKKAKKTRLDFFEKIVTCAIILLAVVNLIGALGPELSFDALWYHLTIPKLFVLNHSVYFIRGNLFYYSLMPKLTEMFYVSSLILGNEILAKTIHYIFGLLVCFILFKIARIYVSRKLSLLAILLFYSNLVIDWLSIAAYVDLSRAFFEVGALYFFIKFTRSKKKLDLVVSSIILGFAISTKLLAIGSILIFVFLILFISKISFVRKIYYSLIIIFTSLIVPLPWFLISIYYSGNPIYPLLSKLFPNELSLQMLSPINFLLAFLNTFLFASDPISPIYIIVLPLILFGFFELFKKYRYILLYSLFSIAIWYISPKEGGSRFIVPFLPIYSLLAVSILTIPKFKYFYRLIYITIFIVAVSSLFYRIAANSKYIPVELGVQSKGNFLMKNLNFNFGDFYDENGIIKRKVNNSTVLLVNMHNLYYVDFPYTLDEWKAKKSYSYILVQNLSLPHTFNKFVPIYKNDITHVTLYKL